MKLWSKVAALAVLACFTTVYAQQAVCTDMVKQALATVDTACAPTGRNQACYGNISLIATPRDGVQTFNFQKQGDLTDVADVASLQLEQLDLVKQVWGIALMKVQANLPDTLPGQNVTFLLFGDVKLDNAASNANVMSVDVTAGQASTARSGPAPQYRILGALAKGQTASATGRSADGSWLQIQVPNSSAMGWVYAAYLTASGDIMTLPVVDKSHEEVAFKPMQAFYFSTGIGQSSCAQAPDGVLIQTPKGQGKINLRANDADIQLGSTAYLQAQPGGTMTISVLEGEGKVTSDGKTVTVPAGTQSQIPLDNDLKANGVPGNAQPYSAGAFANLPISLLPLPITIAKPVNARVFPTWTRAPRLPTATQSASIVSTDVPTLEPTYADVSPTYEAPTYEAPTDAPTYEAPISDAPPADAPTVEAPTDAPVSDAPPVYDSPTPVLEDGYDVIPTEQVTY